MRTLRLLLTVLCCTVLMGKAACAESAFFVQLGKAASEKEAAGKWKDLQSKYPALLSDLQYAPRTVTAAAGGLSEFRVQAGPAKSRDAARHICAILMAKDVECFIVETAMFNGEASYPTATTSSEEPDKEFASAAPEEKASPAAEKTEETPAPAAEKTESPEKAEKSEAAPPAGEQELASAETPPKLVEEKELPAVKEPEAAAAPVPGATDENIKKVTTAGDLPWLHKPEAAPAPQEEAAAESKLEEAEAKPIDTSPRPAPPAPKGRVDVAEAIPVPLSNDTVPTKAKEEQKEVEAPPPPARMTRYHPPLHVPDAAWLQIAGFVSEQDAYSFFEALSKHLDDHGSLRVRITQHMHLRHQSAQAELDIGPVENDKVADICSFASGYDATLHCGRNEATLAEADVSHAELTRAAESSGSYIPPVHSRPHTMSSTKVESLPSASPSAGYPSTPPSAYYVQLSSWPNKSQALRHWEKLKAAHHELAGQQADIRPPARSSLNARPTVRLRVGPFDEREEAEHLCGKLKKHHVSCLVVPE